MPIININRPNQTIQNQAICLDELDYSMKNYTLKREYLGMINHISN